MNKREYAEQVARLVNGEVKETEKPNGIVLTGVIRKDGEISPVFYVEQFIEEGKEPEEMADFVMNYKADFSFDVNTITDYTDVKPMLRARLYNESTVAEVKRSASEYGFNDLIIIPYIEIADNASIKVTDALVNGWKVTADQVLDDAIANAKKDICISTMFETLMGIMPKAIDEFDFLNADDSVPMYVITNKRKSFGAIAGALGKAKLSIFFDKGYVILPSSVHEVIAVPNNVHDKESMVAMVREINATQVAPQEQLSNNIYTFA